MAFEAALPDAHSAIHENRGPVAAETAERHLQYTDDTHAHPTGRHWQRTIIDHVVNLTRPAKYLNKHSPAFPRRRPLANLEQDKKERSAHIYFFQSSSRQNSMQECNPAAAAAAAARNTAGQARREGDAWLMMTRATCASHIYRKQSGRNSLAGLGSSGRAEARAKKIRLHPIRRFCGGIVSPLGKRQKLSFCRCRRDMRFLCGFPCGPKVRRVTCRLGRRRANGGVGSRGKRGSPNIISSWLDSS